MPLIFFVAMFCPSNTEKGKLMTTKAGNFDRAPALWRIVIWGGAALLLLIPALAMQVTQEVDWTAGDFVVAAVLLGTVAFALDLIVRIRGSLWRRAGLVLATGVAFFTVWSNLAVGIIGNENNSFNQLYFIVLLIAMASAGMVRFRSRPMAIVCLAMAASHVVLGAIAAGMGSYPVWPIAAFFAVLWIATALPLWLASRSGA
ncbi:hypothetical protein [Erythrobacter sp. 3-20A1M]|uniref:hypothetical protein n=1 Tax=Erythrobacter sp. 3-20A1M TaxID=2653850 RepID=UPI001BFCA1FD|nr:hypothetical protein [Erythrobacter sp. 3-20A1M]